MAVRSSTLVLVCVFLLTVRSAADEEENVYSFTVKDIQGKNVSLSDYKGKVLLIVNVASLCGYTDINYRELIWLQQHHAPQGFSVLAFPCNQFGAQEPWPEEDILAWVEETYADVNFPLFSKVKVFGDDADPLYKYLVRETGSGPRWNFAKYLVNRNGVPVAFFTTTSSFEDVNRYLEGMLEGKDEL